ncbi:FRIGIDA-like protein 4a [Rhodamnia argentea]|uniref:FRIGIDA-like protein n=1 Tax=Rhodamnia argentea TaxID=178133 RepID=A0A8B8P5L9_9MYRT|nr:FRIGIDA-like protein 4a [Rhodamnia argentea]
MAGELVINTDRVQKFVGDLESQMNALSACTRLFATLSDRLHSLQRSLDDKSHSVESDLQSLVSSSHQALDSLCGRMASLPNRESFAVALVEERKAAALADLDNPSPSGACGLSESLRSFARRMDSSGLVKFLVSKRKESASLRAEMPAAIAEAVDPPRLVLDAVEEFLENKSAKVGVADKRWACGLLVQALFPEAKRADARRPEYARSVVERAAALLDAWRKQVESVTGAAEAGEESDGAIGPAEAVMILQMVVAFGLKSRFDEGFLRKLVVDFARRRDLAKLAVALDFGEKLADIIEELVKNGKEVEAVYFAAESGMTDRFSPASLLKSYLGNAKKNAQTVLKSGNNSMVSAEEASTIELSAIKTVVKCVEDQKLESVFSLDSLKKRAAILEKAKAERKKNSTCGSKPSNKRALGPSSSHGDGQSSSRPAKALKFANPSLSFGRRNPLPLAHLSSAVRYSTPYSYPGQGAYEVPSMTAYTPAYGRSHSPAEAQIVIQQEYSPSATYSPIIHRLAYSPIVDASGGASLYRAAPYVPPASHGMASHGMHDYDPHQHQYPSYGQ